MASQDTTFRRIVEHQFTAVVVLDGSGVISQINSAAELLLVRSKKQLIGQPLSSLFKNASDIDDVLRSAMDEGASVSVRTAKWRFHHREELTLDYIVSPFMERGELNLIVEMQATDRSTRIVRGEGLQDQSQTSRHLVRGLAHEIKNPLGGIRGAAQLLASELPNAELQEYTQVIIEEADRLRQLVDRLLGSHELPDFHQINIHQVLERVCSLLRAEAGSRVRIERDYDPSIPDITADESQLIQVFLNIARNAFQALTESGKENAQILFRTRTVRQFTIRQKRHRIVLRVDVIDNGPGIERDLLEKIFYPMISGRANGTGLGLSIVQQFVDLHCGTVECDSEPGRTQFSVYFPLEAMNG